VSRRLAAFEEALGVQLFERTRDGVLRARTRGGRLEFLLGEWRVLDRRSSR
jgi:DNA-binding transcriptional LysR family regulator